MKKFLIIIILLISVHTSSFSQITTWEYSLDNSSDMNLYDLIEIYNRIFIVGAQGNYDNNNYNGYIIKLNKEGILIDSTSFVNNDTSTRIINVIKNLNNDSSLVLNTMFNTIIGQNNYSGFKITNIDTNFSLLNETVFSFPLSYPIIQLLMRKGSSNKLLVVGTTKINITSSKLFLYTLDNNFDSINAKIFINDPAFIPGDIHELYDSTFWLVNLSLPNYWHIDSNLNVISTQAGDVPHFLTGNYGIKWDSDTSFYLAGDYTFDIKRVTDHDIGFTHQFTPFDSTGNIFNWWGTIDTIDFPAYYGALDYQNKDSIFIGGNKNLQYGNILFGTIPSWYVLLQTDSMLNIRWEHFYGGDACYNMTKLIATSDGGCIMAGARFDFKVHPWVRERDIYILKVNAEGLITSTNEQPASIVHDAIVYPNPGSNVLRVQVAAQHPESIFKLYDMSGKLVLQSPIHGKTATFNITFLPSATYVYTITAETDLNEKGKWVKQ